MRRLVGEVVLEPDPVGDVTGVDHHPVDLGVADPVAQRGFEVSPAAIGMADADLEQHVGVRGGEQFAEASSQLELIVGMHLVGEHELGHVSGMVAEDAMQRRGGVAHPCAGGEDGDDIGGVLDHRPQPGVGPASRLNVAQPAIGVPQPVERHRQHDHSADGDDPDRQQRQPIVMGGPRTRLARRLDQVAGDRLADPIELGMLGRRQRRQRRRPCHRPPNGSDVVGQLIVDPDRELGIDGDERTFGTLDRVDRSVDLRDQLRRLHR